MQVVSGQKSTFDGRADAAVGHISAQELEVGEMSKLLCKAQIGSHAHREDNSITGYGHLAAVRLLEDTARWGDFQQLMLCKLTSGRRS